MLDPSSQYAATLLYAPSISFYQVRQPASASQAFRPPHQSCYVNHARPVLRKTSHLINCTYIAAWFSVINCICCLMFCNKLYLIFFTFTFWIVTWFSAINLGSVSQSVPHTLIPLKIILRLLQSHLPRTLQNPIPINPDPLKNENSCTHIPLNAQKLRVLNDSQREAPCCVTLSIVLLQHWRS